MTLYIKLNIFENYPGVPSFHLMYHYGAIILDLLIIVQLEGIHECIHLSIPLYR